MAGCEFSSGLYQDILNAQEYITNQDYQKAAQVYETVLSAKPPEAIKTKVRFQLGEIYSIYMNDHKKALIHFKEIIKESNEPAWQVKASEKIASIYFESTKEYIKAEKSYAKLVAFKPVLDRYNFYRFRLGLSLFNLKKFGESSKIFNQIKKVKKETEESSLAYYYLGLTNFYLQKHDEAIKNWFEYLKREKRKDKIVQVKFMIANSYESSEKLKEAYNIYYSIIGEYPNSEVIKDKLESLYKRRIARKR